MTHAERTLDTLLARASSLSDAAALPEALACHDEIIALFPNEAVGYAGRAVMLSRTGRFADAVRAYRQALARAPGDPSLLASLGAALNWAGDPAGALTAFDRALARDPDSFVAQFNKAAMLLLHGQLRDGFPLYECRWAHETLAPRLARLPASPRWLGETGLAGKRLLVYWEQGLGDTIQFCRYAALAAAEGAEVAIAVQRPLVTLMRSLPGVRVLDAGEPAPSFDLHCPLLSLPIGFGTTMETIPAAVPYLAADPARVAVWRDRLAGLPRPRIGLVWAGGAWRGDATLAAMDRSRSIPLAELAPLAGPCFVSLQVGRGADPPPPGMVVHDWTGSIGDFADTAALIENLDLTIGVDTAVVHLAGAMGKPVWLLNRFDTDWRWFLDRDDSPWYPSLRQFRQTVPGEWGPAIARVAEALREI